ncbi:hypothetical protein BOTBODRAFT_543895 [Botryobasidium botryosum FD-172 SS1]|uniref:Uncharacterized protein n=1 Tax=Botryobasidium botryosum (strain FD-172 SS1) TaxID=930990 RepID=A0A067MT99_BOTB1|nr:hypothetical protein BOTBODRAFT_543895 [Botryobasidium botryosum FD-172 SS1]
MILTMGSLIMSVSLMWRYQRQLGQVSGLRAVMDEFIYSPDTEVLTILLSLPLAFLIWSVIAFAVAVVSYSFSFTPYWECSIGTLIALVLVIFASTVSWFVHIHLSNTIYVCKRAWRGLRGAGWSLLSGKETESEMSMGGSFGQA